MFHHKHPVFLLSLLHCCLSCFPVRHRPQRKLERRRLCSSCFIFIPSVSQIEKGRGRIKAPAQSLRFGNLRKVCNLSLLGRQAVFLFYAAAHHAAPTHLVHHSACLLFISTLYMCLVGFAVVIIIHAFAPACNSQYHSNSPARAPFFCQFAQGVWFQTPFSNLYVFCNRWKKPRKSERKSPKALHYPDFYDIVTLDSKGLLWEWTSRSALFIGQNWKVRTSGKGGQASWKK